MGIYGFQNRIELNKNRRWNKIGRYMSVPALNMHVTSLTATTVTLTDRSKIVIYYIQLVLVKPPLTATPIKFSCSGEFEIVDTVRNRMLDFWHVKSQNYEVIPDCTSENLLFPSSILPSLPIFLSLSLEESLLFLPFLSLLFSSIYLYFSPSFCYISILSHSLFLFLS